MTSSDLVRVSEFLSYLNVCLSAVVYFDCFLFISFLRLLSTLGCMVCGRRFPSRVQGQNPGWGLGVKSQERVTGLLRKNRAPYRRVTYSELTACSTAKLCGMVVRAVELFISCEDDVCLLASCAMCWSSVCRKFSHNTTSSSPS